MEDIGSLIPSLDSLLGKLDLLVRVLVIAGPLVLLGLGLYYFLMPPGEANHSAGYRFRYGMRKVKSWRFMQRVAGIGYSVTGLVLTVVMAIMCIRLGAMEIEEMLWFAAKCILWELVSIVAATVVINVIVVLAYDSMGNNRAEMRRLFKDFEEEEE